MSESLGKELIIAGGTVRQSDGGIIGDATVAFMSQFKVDYAIIGASAIDQDGAVLDFDWREVSVARTLIANARQTILVADSSKFARRAPVRICHISAISAFVTDERPPSGFCNICKEHDVDVIVANGLGSEERT